MLSARLDGTPLLGGRTGVGRYTEHLVRELAARNDVSVGVTAFTLRGAGGLPAVVPAGVTTRSLPIPARLLRRAWAATGQPPVWMLAGRSDVFHGTNFVLPPTGRAAGVVTVHDLTYLMHPDTVDAASRELLDLVPRSLRRAGAVATPTRAVAEAVGDAYRIDSDKIVVTPLGVTRSWFDTAPATTQELRAWGLPPRYLLFVGAREPRKDLATLLAAHARAQAVEPDTAPLLLVGPDGWGGSAGRPSSDVRLAGYQDQRRLPAIVAAAEALVLPSLYEGFGMPALEAMATGTRTIVSDAAALLEVTGGHAEVFTVRDVDALADLLTPRADEPSAPDRRRRWAAGWTWQACAEATMTAYRTAIG